MIGALHCTGAQIENHHIKQDQVILNYKKTFASLRFNDSLRFYLKISKEIISREIYILKGFNLQSVPTVILLRLYLRDHRHNLEDFYVGPSPPALAVQTVYNVFVFGLQENSHRDLFSSSHGALEAGQGRVVLQGILDQSNKI